MRVFVNGESVIENVKTLDDVCLLFSHDPHSIATALNNNFVPKTARMHTMLSDGDHIEIIAPFEGG